LPYSRRRPAATLQALSDEGNTMDQRLYEGVDRSWRWVCWDCEEAEHYVCGPEDDCDCACRDGVQALFAHYLSLEQAAAPGTRAALDGADHGPVKL
jgi:hypothetical protein